MPPYLRLATPDDTEALYDICVRTADGGGDGRGLYSADELVGDVFAVPYLVLEPAHTHVLDDGTGQAVGYVLGTPDTAGFVRRYRDEWLPTTADRYPLPQDPPRSADDVMLALHHRPERMLVPGLEDHPAHLHIDLLPDWQGGGWGRRLIERFVAGVAAAGAPGVHLVVLSSNTAARAFYARVGFTEAAVDDPAPVTYLVRSTAQASGSSGP